MQMYMYVFGACSQKRCKQPRHHALPSASNQHQQPGVREMDRDPTASTHLKS